MSKSDDGWLGQGPGPVGGGPVGPNGDKALGDDDLPARAGDLARRLQQSLMALRHGQALNHGDVGTLEEILSFLDRVENGRNESDPDVQESLRDVARLEKVKRLRTSR